MPKLAYFCQNGIPFGSGLGSSSAAIVSGLLAGLVLTGQKLKCHGAEELLQIAATVEGEHACTRVRKPRPCVLAFACFACVRFVLLFSRVSSSSLLPSPQPWPPPPPSSTFGIIATMSCAWATPHCVCATAALCNTSAISAGHTDNLAPCIYGGAQIGVFDTDQKRWDTHAVPVPNGLRCVIFTPDTPMSTEFARSILPKMIDRKDAVFNLGRTALLVLAFCTDRLELLKTATEDRLHQPCVPPPPIPPSFCFCHPVACIPNPHSSVSRFGKTIPVHRPHFFATPFTGTVVLPTSCPRCFRASTPHLLPVPSAPSCRVLGQASWPLLREVRKPT
jgi:hypothetical protein